MAIAKKKNCTCCFDEKTLARLERERLQALKGLLRLGFCKKIRKKEGSKSQKEGEHESGKDEIEGEKSKEIIKPTGYQLAKSWKLKSHCLIKEEERRKALLNQYKRWKFYTALIKLKTNYLNQEWNYACHLRERTIIRENERLETIERLRWEYNIDEKIPPDSIVFDKILRYKRERRKRLKLQKERTIMIVEKITREMINGIRFLRKPININVIRKIKETKLQITVGRSSTEISAEETEKESSENESKNLEENIATTGILDISADERKISKPMQEEKIGQSEGETIQKLIKSSDKIAIAKRTKSSEEIYPEDTCFFSTPSIVIFSGFDANKVYSKKVTITNKTTKWAYIRFHKVNTDVWEPVIEIGIIDAAKVKAGLCVTVNVKFSPVNREKVIAEISFLTRSPDDPNTFHEFRVPVRCTPGTPLPVVEPRELRFPSAPIWKYNDSKFKEKVLTIYNDGETTFSILIGERNDRDDCFRWFFDEGEAQSAKSSMLLMDEGSNEGINSEIVVEKKLDSQDYRKMYQIEVPPKLKCTLRIAFRPKYIGLHHEVLEIFFSDDERIFDKQNVPIWAEVTGYQINLDPPCIDLGIVMIDSDVCQQSFNIVNTARTGVEVLMKTPKRLGSQVTVHPKSTIVQPETIFTISVRLIPESTIIGLSRRFYDRTSKILEFPIQVQILFRDSEQPPPLILKVLATLTTCRGLILEPSYVDLGLVYTHESVYTELTLTNKSLLIQEYAFVNLPPFMEIHPNYGFGAILPGETIKLHLIYSACSMDIPGNETGRNGLAGERIFKIQAITLAELVGKKGRIKLNELRSLNNMSSMIERKHHGLPPPMSPELINETTDDNQTNQAEDFFVEDSDEDVEVFEDATTKRYYKREKKNVMDVRAYIVDTFCELSEQIIDFPATPCGSFSVVSVYLRGFNMASYPHCTCGIIKNQNKEFTARFEFKCSSDQMGIVPQSGDLISNQFIQVNFIFKPRLSQNIVSDENNELKINIEKDEKKSMKREKTRKKASKKKEKLEEKKDHFDMDKLINEIDPLETLEPFITTIFVTCIIDLEMRNGAKHEELLFGKLICPVTRPDILILNEHEIDFGSTAIGLSSRKFLFVKNTSNKSVKVNVGLLDPFGPFFVPPGKTIETGSILKLPVTYTPTQDQAEEEYFEVCSPITRTKWRVRVTGRGVVPSYVLKPRFRVARFEVYNDPVELKISIQNTGTCSLTFQLRIMDILEGNIPRDRQESPGKSSKTKKKKKTDKESDRKSPRKTEFGDDLQPQEELAIFGGNLKRSTDHGYFSFGNFDENMQLTIGANKKVEFIVRFQPRNEEKISQRGEVTSKRGKKMKKSERKEETEKLNYCYVALLKLMLGSSIVVHDFVMICSTK